jgi:selenocysteine lyase/cysteine desulfurase
VIYLDHAATSFPKAPGVAEECARFLREDAGNPGRGAHTLAGRALDALERGRQGLALLVGAPDARRLALTSGATEALNVALHGVLSPGDRVLIGPEAHNSVLRPLRVLEGRLGLQIEEVATDDDLRWDLADLETKLREETALVAVAHGSNVTGAVQDLAAIVARAHDANALVLVDGAQTVGAVPTDVAALGLDLLAFSGHKALLGPTGTGALYVRPGLSVRPLLTGGTGTSSEREDPPLELPHALEAGTANAVGFAGLAVAVRAVRERTPAAIHAHTASLGDRLRAGVAALPGAVVHGASRPADLAVVSFTVSGWDPNELATVLDAQGIALRAGLHCAPRAHRRLGTLAGGTLRASPGPYSSEDDVATFLERLTEVL